MHRLLCSALAWVVFATPVVARAEPVVCSSAGGLVTPTATPTRDVTLDGRPGVWFVQALAQDAYAALESEDGYLEQLALASRRLELRAQESSALRLAAAASSRRADELRGALRLTEAARVRAVERMNAWYRAPLLWTGVGFVLGAGLAVFLAFAIGESVR